MKTKMAIGVLVIAGFMSISVILATAQDFLKGGYQGGQYGKGGVEEISGIDQATISNRVMLSAFPNPVLTEAAVTYNLPDNEDLELAVFDLNSRKVKTLVARRDHPPGEYILNWNVADESGNPLAIGVYYYRLKTGKSVLTIKFIKIQ